MPFGATNSFGDSLVRLVQMLSSPWLLIPLRGSVNTLCDLPLFSARRLGWRRRAALHDDLHQNRFASHHLSARDKAVMVSVRAVHGPRASGFESVCMISGGDGPAPPAAVYIFVRGRRADWPAAYLERFLGVLHDDGYAGFEPEDAMKVVLAARRAQPPPKFYEVARLGTRRCSML